MKKLILATAGDREMTLEEVYEQYKNSLYGFSKNYFFSFGYDDAMQIASEALIKAYNTYDPSKYVPFILFLCMVVDQAFKNQHRSMKRHNRLDAVSLEEMIFQSKSGNEDINIDDILKSNDDTEEAAIRIIQIKSLRNALNMLKPEEKAMLKSYYYKGMTQGEIGKVLDMGQVRVSRAITRAIQKLRALMEEGA